MSRRRSAGLEFLAAFALAVGLACSDGSGRDSAPPNVVIYLVDTLRADHLGIYGYERDTAPRLREFAKDAVVFEDALAPSSWTRPSAATVLSGQSPARHGAIGRANPIAPGVKLLGELLAPAGYHTAAFSSNANVLPVWGFGRGFDAFYDIESVAFTANAAQVNDVVFKHLDEQQQQPLAFYVHSLDPHGPYEPPAPFDRKWPRPTPEELASDDPGVSARARVADTMGAYDGEISFNDHHFGELLDRLRAEGLYEDSLVIFTADHGEEFWDHGAVGHGYSLFQEVVRVPLVVKFPGNAHAGQRVEAEASLLDIVPTVLAAAGLDSGPELEGVDLRGLIEPAAPAPPRARVLDLNLTGVTEDRFIADSVVFGGYKLLTTTEPRRGIALFDLVGDPKERQSRLGKEREVAGHLQRLLQGHRRGAQGGVHFWVLNAGDDLERVATGRLRTSSRFENLRPGDFEAGDEASLSSDGTLLTFRLGLRNFPNPVDNAPTHIVDHDRLTFDVSDADAEVIVEEFAIDGQAAPIHLGAGKQRAGVAPLPLGVGSPDLKVPRMDAVLAEGIENSLLDAMGAYVGVVRRPASQEIEMDPALRDRLRQLGYVE